MDNSKLPEDYHQGPTMTWLLNHRCNYSCNYCFLSPAFLSKEHPLCGQYSPEHIGKCFDNTDQTWWIHLTGGEPFLYPNFVELCTELTRNHYITINTNLSTLNTIKFADTINPEKVYSVNAALHIQEREKRRGLSRYLTYLRYFQEKGFLIRVVYLVHPSLFPRLDADIRMLKEEGAEIVDLKVFRGYYHGKKYPGAYALNERQIIQKNAIDKLEVNLIDQDFNFFGKPCSTGVDFFVMDAAGNVRRCSSSTRSYGNLFSGDFKADTINRPCPFLYCSCPYEGLAHSSNTRHNSAALIKEILLESPSYFYKKARPSKVFHYIRKRLAKN